MLSLSLRTAKIGNQVQTNGEKHGDDSVTAFYIPVGEVMLDGNELNALLADPHAYNALFNDEANNITKPVFSCFKPLALKHKFAGGTVKFVHGLGKDEITFTACKISKVKLDPQDGGMTALSFTVQTVPVLDDRAAKFLAMLNHDVEIEVSAELAGEDAQQDLPLNQHGEGEQPQTPKRRGRKARSSSAALPH